MDGLRERTGAGLAFVFPMNLKIVLAGLLVLRLWTAAFAEAITQPLPAARAARVDAAVKAEMKKEQAVGMAVGIIEQGNIVYLQGYGFADREKNLPVTTNTMFRWASCSKPLAALAALQLTEKGQLDLDADVRKYVPEFADKGVVITARELLCHQSGIVHYSNGKVIPTERKYETPHPFADPVMALDKFNESPLLFKPGEKFSYTSYGYLLLSAVVQRAGREKFADQIEERIARPLKMTTLQPDYQWMSIAHRAVGYHLENDRVLRSTDTDQSWKWGAGGYISTVGDFARFAEGLLHGQLVTSESQARMWERQKTSDGKATDYGLGFEVQVNVNGKLIKVFHDGKQEKTRTRFVIYPGAKNGVVIMTNSEWINPATFSTLIYAALTTN
jgi:serine beta-lactamase-like protein LACTB